MHPEIANPDYKEADAANAYHVCDPCAAVGFELWQVKSGTIFDDIIVTDSLAELAAFEASTFEAEKDAEKTAYDAIQAVSISHEGGRDAGLRAHVARSPSLTNPCRRRRRRRMLSAQRPRRSARRRRQRRPLRAETLPRMRMRTTSFKSTSRSRLVDTPPERHSLVSDIS